MNEQIFLGDKLLDVWLNLTSTLWNTRLVCGMTYNEAHVLGILLRRSTPQTPVTATDLIRRTRLLKSQMNKILTTLETQGYITRTRSESDKRLIHIFLTQQGKDAYLEQHKNVDAILCKLLDRIGDACAMRAIEDLHTITLALDDILDKQD